MTNRALKSLLGDTLKSGTAEKKLPETVALCIRTMKERRRPEPRTGFFRYLSDVFRFEGRPILALQAAALAVVCLYLTMPGPEVCELPAYMQLFPLCLLPVLFRGRIYGMEEIEAATRASGAQILLAKLVLAGAADLVCLTVLLVFELRYCRWDYTVAQVLLYCLVPYLASMSAVLWLLRSGRKPAVCAGALLICSLGWWLLSRVPRLFEAASAGLWAAAFVVFTGFFIREAAYITAAKREGKIYGTVA